MRSRLPRIGARVALAAASMLLTLLLLEGSVRLVAPQPVLFSPEIWVPRDDGLGHGLAPNLDTRVNTGEREVRFRTDSLGHRIGDTAPEVGALRVLALGDSFLEAMAVEYEDGVSAQLSSLLSAALARPVEVVNTGVSGSAPDRYLGVAKQELARSDYAAVVAFLYLGNDIVERRVEVRPPRRPTLRHGLQWPREQSVRAWVDGVIHPLYTQLREHSQLVLFLKGRLLPLWIRLGLTDHEFPAALLRAQAGSPRFDVTRELCRDIAATSKSHGPVLFVLLPPDFVVDPEMGRDFALGSGLSPDAIDLDQAARILGEGLRAEGVAVVDATPALREARATGTPLYGSVDRHLSPRGHRVVAELVAPALLALLADPTAAPPR